MSEESAAIILIKRAVEFDASKRYADALVCYKEGISLLMESLKSNYSLKNSKQLKKYSIFLKAIQDERKKNAFREKILTYIDRAEKLKKIVEELKDSEKYHEQIQIKEASIGHSYEKVFSRFFVDEVLDLVEIEDPYIKTRHQTMNFLKFIEMIIKNAKSVKKIILLTTRDNGENQQESRLAEIQESLMKRQVELKIEYSTSLHDREIKLSNGWIIKIGRGLDYFKAPESANKLCIGFTDYDLRPCHETTIDIFHKNNSKNN